MLPLIVRPALLELTGAAPGSPEFQMWVGRLFYIPAFAGGIFGLLGGYLTDRFGRRRVLTCSILLYAFSRVRCRASRRRSRCCCSSAASTFIGVCVEFVAAVAWLAELFPEPKRREKVLGYTQAFSSLGGLLVRDGQRAVRRATPRACRRSTALRSAAIADPHAPWRYTLMSGVIPAIPLILIRPFLPESPIWQQKKAAGTLKRPSIAALFSPELRRTTIVTTIMFAMATARRSARSSRCRRSCPACRKCAQMVAGRSRRRQARADRAARSPRDVTKVQEIGGLVGRFLLAYLAVVIVSRRKLIRLFQVPGLIVMPIVFA